MEHETIDWARVEELRADIGDDDFAEVAALFLEEVSDGLDSLRDRAGTELSEGLHAVRGAALNLGFARLAQLAARGEAAVETVDVGALRTCYSDSLAAMRERYPSMG